MTEKNNQLNEKVKSVSPVRTGVPRSADESITLPSAISTVTADPLRHSFSEASRNRRRSNGVNLPLEWVFRTCSSGVFWRQQVNYRIRELVRYHRW